MVWLQCFYALNPIFGPSKSDFEILGSSMSRIKENYKVKTLSIYKNSNFRTRVSRTWLKYGIREIRIRLSMRPDNLKKKELFHEKKKKNVSSYLPR